MVCIVLLCLLLPAVYAVRRSYRSGRIEINHVTLFTLGFLSYWIIPVGLALLLGSTLRSTLGDELIDMYSDATNLIEYMIIATLIYLSFIAGDAFARRTKIRPSRHRGISENLLFQFSVIAGLIAAGAMFAARDILLQGSYVTDSDNPLSRGTAAAACIFLFMIGMIHIVQTRPTMKSLLFSRYMLFFWPANLVLFLSGTRLYFISFVLMIMVYWTNFRSPIRLGKLLVMLLGPILLVGVIGAYRLRGGDHSIIANLIEEPMFTSFSLAAFLQSKHFFLLKVPIYLASDLLNLIPSALFPNKTAYMTEIPDVYSPLGAMNSFVSFQWNFGIIGTVIFIFFTGYALGRMRRRQDLWSRVAYIMTTGWLAFTFFRDPFSVALVKNILEFSLILPAVIIAISRFAAYAINPMRHAGVEAR